ncbi:DeoR family transcriptional regulator [Methanosarcina barkeri]|uniref:DeoR family transcriptional regulator n=1 Tax=Methanosarcina barkeri TaxID=2208 RepID=UPI00064ECA41|nr:DeoR family transcriptional regulator [Methanosarcina barkeri]
MRANGIEIKEPERYVSTTEIKSNYNVACDTARNDLQYLAKLGYIEMIKRCRSYMYRYKRVRNDG